MAEVLLKNLVKIYQGDYRAVNNVNLTIHDREFVVIVGPSGCGKSTTLRMIAGLEDITDGEIYIGDRLVNHIESKDRNISMVFQNYALYPHMSAFKNISFGLEMRKYKKADIEKRVAEAAAMLGIEGLLDRKPGNMSGGEKQRVALGRAVVREPDVFLFDEPLSNLDAKLKTNMRLEIIKLHQKLQTTFVYVTHDQIEALTMADRIVVMDKGVIQQVDTPDNLYRNPVNLFVAGFIGSPTMNFIKGEIVASAGGLGVSFHGNFMDIEQGVLDKATLKKYENRHIIIGVRPEHILPGAENGIRIHAEITEMTGADHYIYGRIGDDSITIRTRESVPADSDIQVAFEKNKLLVFDAETGQNINPAAHKPPEEQYI